MLAVTVHIEAPRRWGLPRRRRRLAGQLPQAWREVPAARRLTWWRWLLTEGESAGRLRIARAALQLPKSVVHGMDPADLATIAGALAWMQPVPNCTDPILETFRHRGVTYHLPLAKFENGTCIEFALAEGYYDNFLKTQDPEKLLLLVATLCREARADRTEALAVGDVRVAVVRKEQVADRAARLRGLPGEVAWAVLLYFAGVKQYVAATYHMLFNQPLRGDDQPDAETPPARGPRFGWWSKYMEVAETGLFGDYETVLQKRLHLVCMYLVDQHEKNERLKAEYERANRKPSSNYE